MSDPPGEQAGIATTALEEAPMNRIIYIVGLVVIVLAILSFVGFR
ncbi:hypothetical protein [Vannielia sp.]|nr:hypothetical protein [Vannielia sp.]MDF1873396.1 hypothetical protein [Vannielia sp.]